MSALDDYRRARQAATRTRSILETACEQGHAIKVGVGSLSRGCVMLRLEVPEEIDSMHLGEPAQFLALAINEAMPELALTAIELAKKQQSETLERAYTEAAQFLESIGREGAQDHK